MIGRFFFRPLLLGLLAYCGAIAATGCSPVEDSSSDPATAPGATAHPSVPPADMGPVDDSSPGDAVEPPSPPPEREVEDPGGPDSATTPKPEEQQKEPKQQAETAKEDPGGKREPLFVGWMNPSVVLFLTGQQQGYIEPCGCTGLSSQKGGLSRKHTLARELVERGWEIVPLDVGNQIRRFGRQAEIKFHFTVHGMKDIGYRAIALGVDDLRLSAMALFAEMPGMGVQSAPFVSANATVFDPSAAPPFQVVEAGGKKIGITAIVGADWQSKISSRDIGLTDPEQALTKVLPELQQQNCDLYVLLAHASIEESKRLAAKFPALDVVVTAGGLGDPLYKPEPIPDSDAILVQVGIKGMHVGVLGMFDDETRPLRYQRVPLDDRFKDSPEMLQLLASYQEQLEALGFDELGVRPLPHPSGGTYVGSEVCADCHSIAYEIWEATPHAHALDSLVHPGERSEVPRHFDPECLSCHVIGWDPQKHFPYATGYLGLDETPDMHHVGCENCHGPGSQHVEAENGDVDVTDQEIDARRAGMRLPLKQARDESCMACHDLDNSPDFHEEGAFEKYWDKVKHEGLD